MKSKSSGRARLRQALCGYIYHLTQHRLVLETEMTEERIASLERQVTTLKRALAALLVSLVVIVSIGASRTQDPGPITATELSLVDSNGKRKAHLSVSPSGSAIFNCFDDKGMFAQLISSTTGGMFRVIGTRSESGETILRCLDGAPEIAFAPRDKTKSPKIQSIGNGIIRFEPDGSTTITKN